MQSDITPLCKETSNIIEQDPILKQPTVTIPLLLGPKKTDTICPFCGSMVNTTIEYRVTSRTHRTAALCTLVCCCCCSVYCCNSAKNTDHYCPSCKRYLGTYEK